MKCSTPNRLIVHLPFKLRPLLIAEKLSYMELIECNSWDLGQYFLLLAPILLTSSFGHASSTRAFNYIESIAWKQKKSTAFNSPPKESWGKSKRSSI